MVSRDRAYHSDEIGFSPRSDLKTPLYTRGQVRQLERVFERAGPFDAVYHCAAEFERGNGEDFYEQLWMTNAVGKKNMIRVRSRRGGPTVSLR